MSLTFLNLCNAVLRRFGAVAMTSSTFPSTTDPEHYLVKDAVNDSIQRINAKAHEWPFNYSASTETLVAGTGTYALATNTKTVDWDSFIIKASTLLGVTERTLKYIDYDRYIQEFAERDGDATATEYDVPQYVYRTPANTIGLTPLPDQTYTLAYTSFLVPTPLALYSDTTRIPDEYQNVIVDGASPALSLKRGNVEQASMYGSHFKSGVSDMRRILINAPTDMKDTRKNRSMKSNRMLRIG